MKRIAFVLLLFAASMARAQSNPPFKNPSLDSNCYFPQIGVPGEIDTIYGDTANEGLGDFIHNLGPQQGGMPGNIILGTRGPFNSLQEPTEYFSTVQTGASFNLHHMKAKAQSFLPDVTNLRFGHFHNSTSVDIFDADNWVIYWADPYGNYDSSNRTQLMSNVVGDNSVGGGILGGSAFIAYAAHLTSDTVEDIVLGYGTLNKISSQDSLILVQFKGGAVLASKSIAYEDTSANFGFITYGGFVNHHDDWTCLQGDFRGTGQQDLLASDKYALFFFRNDQPFSLTNLAQALRYDTLWNVKDNKDWKDTNYSWLVEPYNAIVMHLLPKKAGDNSVDFAASFPTTNDSNNGIFIFRGGPEFGSHRITIDSAAYVILPPKLGYQIWPGAFTDGGDMTGTGNHVFCTGGGAGGAGVAYADQNYYVMGQALDNKIDIFYKDCSAGLGDTMTANGDSLEDLLLGNEAYDDPQDQSNGKLFHGTIWLMYGSKNIPVHLNPQFAEVKTEIEKIPQNDGAGISFAPNPITESWSVATIIWPEAEPEAEYAIYDMLGREMDRGTIRLLGGPEQQRIYFSNLPQGTYIYVITGSKHSASAKIVKLSPASSGTSSQPNIIQQMKQARDGVK